MRFFLSILFIVLLPASLYAADTKTKDTVETVKTSETSAKSKQEDAHSAAELKKAEEEHKKKSEQHEKMRLEALSEAAREYGFQKGFSDRYTAIQKECESRGRELDETYPFHEVLLQNGTIQPPIITKTDDYTEKISKDKLVRTGTAYRIIRSAEFVTNPPSWRTYLLLEDAALHPEELSLEILPKTSKEKKYWQGVFSKAYSEGVQNADLYFEEELARLHRDFSGMILYHILHRQGKISLPGISKGHFALKISEDTMELDQRTFIITDRPAFQDMKKWRDRGKR